MNHHNTATDPFGPHVPSDQKFLLMRYLMNQMPATDEDGKVITYVCPLPGVTIFVHPSWATPGTPTRDPVPPTPTSTPSLSVVH